LRFLAALKFLTIIPLPWWREVSSEEVGRSTGYFPVAGIIIGLILAGLNWLLGLVLPSAIVNALLIVSLVLISGALHLDGFVDTCDGMVKYVSLNSVPEPLLMATLVLMPVLSRWAMVYAIFAYPYARPSGVGKVFKQEASWQRLVIATLIALAVALVLAQLAGLVIMLGVWVIVVAMASYLKRKFSGLTGDTYGAINEVAEVCVLVLVCLLAHNRWLGLA